MSQEDVIKKQYYTIGEVAKELDLTTSSVRLEYTSGGRGAGSSNLPIPYSMTSNEKKYPESPTLPI